MLWDCPAYVSIRSAFMLELRRELGDRFEHFQSLDSFEKSSYVLGSEAWEEYSSGLLGLIKDFVLSVWEERKVPPSAMRNDEISASSPRLRMRRRA